ncbi:azurin [Chiayiivirga flava]|uniref:Azurin n=1 Tax=Chiayiivirga flava TaxID=659595 RepID=A0A7W8D7U7_9GAMM|nr:azurin [Chiayiivirga flava]MBB5209561.1 azurin [Chiayiivirga flava]
MLRQILLTSALALCSAPVFAAGECAADISGDDAMKFDTASIEVPATCKQFTVTLKHTGVMAKNVMGHNWVLSKTADVQGVATDGMTAGLASAYVKPGDTRVIAHTDVIGGGESTSVTFDVAGLAAGEAYTYFCSFPGHWALMKGTLTVK